MAFGKKGAVRIELLQSGRLRLRWNYEGKDVTLAIGKHDPLNNLRAELIALQIAIDLMTAQYDKSLARYRQILDPTYAPRVVSVGVLDLFSDFYSYRSKTLSRNSETKYAAVMRHLDALQHKKAAQVDERLAEAFMDSLHHLKIGTRRSYLALLDACWDFGKLRYGLANNPWKLIRLPMAQPVEPDPFTLPEVQRILVGFAESHYYSFVCLLLATGCRIGEASALRWGDFDWEQGVISVAKSWDGKGIVPIKNRKSRTVPIVESLRSILWREGLDPDALAFPAPKGNYIDRRLFLRRHWKPTLEKVGVRYRSTYKCRHTVWSHAVLTMPIATAAKVAGNLPSTLLRNYVGSITASPMPDLLSQPDIADADADGPDDLN
jgi:integrase